MQLTRKSKAAIIIGLLPAFLIYAVFAIYPILQSFYYSLMEWDGFTDMTFIGLDNFRNLFEDPLFWNSVKNNLYVVFASVLGQVPIALFFALLLNRKIKGVKFFRTVGFLPVVLSTVVISLTWSLIYNSQNGMLNEFLRSIGLGFMAQNWLGDTKWVMIAVLVTVVWQFVGLYFIIFLAALQNVPTEVLEAAKMDGASEWTTTFKITIPMIWDTIIVAVILCISGSLKTFDLIYVMTNGGPAHSSDVMALYMFHETFNNLQYGYGSAVSVFIFFFSLILIFIVTKLLGKKMI
ncbi:MULTISPECIES: sugar ABC transporter permease [Oceanobacillus]|uniref:carbohydrate ABC transporter permease n=1 Tax=Oceanobacillus TaxID=182709 RepID=UPI000345C045|nr:MULTISPECIES: sugar ABC transporter permease [Oceanobacillus]MBT2600976.1 sugar ABC transporter permease [Oceanobacillus sp. ISL-74]MBT2653573.1 sugar ABC transporter permease [Oceanobacillus sp. ISL-73]MCT1578750.1 sugar ABC transporter permease [Oceanobacillus kimchii]MCT2137800.1 sugar ABC transporter permease [Oceanobacillus kimchii]